MRRIIILFLLVFSSYAAKAQSIGSACPAGEVMTAATANVGAQCAYPTATNNPATSTLFTQTSALTYGNSTALTNLIGSGIGITTLPANFWAVGRQIRIKGRGIYSSATLAPSITLSVTAGGVQLATATVSNLLNSASNAGFQFEQIITCTATGSCGSLSSNGSLSFSTGTGLVGAAYTNGTATVNTTATQALGVNAAWGSASASNTLTVQNVSIEELN